MILNGDGLSVYDVYDIAVNKAKVSLDEMKLNAVKGTYDRIQQWGSDGYPIYGVNTGFGELAHIRVPPQKKTELQCNLLRSHAAGSGEPFGDDVVRAIIAVRLNCLMRGYSGVSTGAVELLSSFLNLGIHPVVPRKGSLGASGDLAPLSHIALSLIGEGHVRVYNEIRCAKDVLGDYGLKPLVLGYKEALALINGTSGMTGLACLNLVKAVYLLKLAVFASADVIQCLEGSSGPFEHRGHVLKNHDGQVQIAAQIRELLKDNSLVREHSDIMHIIQEKTRCEDRVLDINIYLQNAYTLRCIPQILGPVLETLVFCRRIIEEEVNSCNDNPLIFDRPEESFHGGHFHGQYVAMASDFLNIASTEIGVLAERQLNRLLDPHINGRLPAFLAAGETGLFCGYEGAQYLATSVASENLDLSAPACVKSIPSNGQNQDVVSMGLIAARKSADIAENVTLILAVLIGACHQAGHVISTSRLSPPMRYFHEQLASTVRMYYDDQPMYAIISAWGDLLFTEEVREFIANSIHFETLDRRSNLIANVPLSPCDASAMQGNGD
jgi:tyrosine 2,3-aminomutase